MRNTLLALVLCGCGPSTAITTASQGCATGLQYQGSDYTVEATWKLLGIKAGSESGAIREVSDTVQIYLAEAANLCDLYAEGQLSAGEYADRRSGLSARFARLVSVTEALPPGEVGAVELPIYRETVHRLREAPGSPVRFSATVSSGGRALDSGAPLKSGAGFAVEMDVPDTAWVYVVLVDSRGGTARLYPGAKTGQQNPVRGRLRIPNDASAELYLDDKPGTERLLFFVERGQSPAIEGLVGVSAEPSRQAGLALTRGVGVRKKLSEVEGSEASSSFGGAALEFLIDHQ